MNDEAKAFHYAVYTAVSQIPRGQVTNYGHIALLIGRPQNSRQVGASLKHSRAILRMFEDEGVLLPELPWWRVVSSGGHIAKRDEGELEQMRRLQAENVAVSGMSVSMAQYGWFPEELDD